MGRKGERAGKGDGSEPSWAERERVCLCPPGNAGFMIDDKTPPFGPNRSVQIAGHAMALEFSDLPVYLPSAFISPAMSRLYLHVHKCFGLAILTAVSCGSALPVTQHYLSIFLGYRFPIRSIRCCQIPLDRGILVHEIRGSSPSTLHPLWRPIAPI